MYRRLFNVPPALVAATGLAVIMFAAAAPDAEASFSRTLSGKLSRNTSVATQQLTADPPQVLNGTLGVSYDPSLVSLYYPPDPLTLQSAMFVQSPGFLIQDIQIGVLDGENNPVFVSQGVFLDSGAPRTETGQIRVTFGRNEFAVSPVVLPPGDGYGPYVTAPGYQQGDDTFGAIF